MPDKGTKKTEKEIKKVEKNLEEIYSEAEKDIQDKLTTFMSKYSAKNQIKLDKLSAGEITQEEYNNWVQGQIFQKKQWQNKHDQIIGVMTNTNKVAVNMVNGSMYGVFAFNSNYQAYQIEKGFGINFGFGLYDTSTVTNLIKNDPQILPKWKINEKKDYIWNSKKVNNAITQGIIQGESLDKITKRISTGLCAQNENLMKTFARTGMTQAQNAGRYQRQMDAKQLGINLVKEWMSTLDGRTRDSHRHMDGEKIKVGDKWHPQKFSNGCRYPGDPEGPPREVYNCRCTLVADLVDYPAEYERYDNIDGKPIKNMTYDEWATAKGGVGHTKTKYKKISGTTTKAQASKLKAAQTALDKAKQELSDIEQEITNKGADKTFTGIWKNQNITYADYDAKKHTIEAKKQYYEYQIAEAKKDFNEIFANDEEATAFWNAFTDYTTGTYDPAKGAKIGELLEKYGYDNSDMSDMYSVYLSSKSKIGNMDKYLNDLTEFETHGEEYSKLLKNRDDIKQKVKEASQEVTNLTTKKTTGGIFTTDAYSEDRKNNALKASTREEADKALRPKTKEVWKIATQDQKEAAYDYTYGSGGFNRPLRGYKGSWNNKGVVGEVSLDYEGKSKKIKDLTSMIEQSSLDQDTWLVRGVNNTGLAGFLGIDEKMLYSSESDLQNLLLGKEISDPAFMSCGSAAGTGFGSNISIYCPKGTKGLYVEPFSYYGSGDDLDWDGESDQKYLGSELETILQRNTKFRVTKVTNNYGSVSIEVEVVGQDPYEISYPD